MAIARGDDIWHAAPGTSGGSELGRDTTTAIGFAGTVPLEIPILTSASTTADIVAALTALGICRPS